jgi:cbb3-type cytochrome c oxidase subunit III
MESRPHGHSDAAIVGFAVGAIVLMVVGVAFASYWAGRHSGRSEGSSQPSTLVRAAAVDPQVSAGAHAFVQFACAQCHGPRGSGGVSSDVPALQDVAQTLTVAQLTSTIEHGAGVSTDATRPFMPVWHGVISKPQIAALVAYMKAGFPAVQYADPEQIPQTQGDEVAGGALYEKYGCVNCHGPNALGGVPNPQSPDTVIPPLTGKDFHEEFDDTAIADIIRSGSVLGRAPIVSMPHWGSILSDRQIAQLVAYIDSLEPSP